MMHACMQEIVYSVYVHVVLTDVDINSTKVVYAKLSGGKYLYQPDGSSATVKMMVANRYWCAKSRLKSAQRSVVIFSPIPLID